MRLSSSANQGRIGRIVGTITSISAYRDSRFIRSQDQDATSYDGYILNSDEHDKTFSQELRLAGDTGRRHYAGGLYYYHATTAYQFDVIAHAAFPTAAVRGRTAQDAGTIKIDSYAAFGQLTYDITDTLSLAAGGRYTKDDKADRRAVLGFFAAAPFIVDPTPSFHAFNPAATLSFKPRAGLLVYASYRQGFKSGGFQGLLPGTPTIASTAFAPEDVGSYELGVKSTLFDRRVQANVAVFRSDITDQQVSRIASASSVLIDNAGATRTDGVDVSLTVRPAPPLTLTASGTYQHARFRQYLNGAANYAGNHQLRSPNFTSYVAADYTAPLGSFGELAAHAEYSYKSKTFYDAANQSADGIFQSGFGVAGARLGVRPVRSSVEIAAFVRNAFDKHYFVNVAIAGQTGLATPGEPRIYGAALSYHF